MARIIDDVEIEYKGETYTCKPTFKFIDMFEKRQGFFQFTQTCGKVDSKISDLAWLIFCALKTANAPCTFDEVGEEYVSDLTYYNNKVTEIVLATFPTPNDAAEEDIKKKTPPMI